MADPTTLTKTAVPGQWADTGAVLTMAAADIVNKNRFVASGNDLIIAHNTSGGALTVTVSSADDPFGRSDDITTYSLAAGAYAILGPFGKPGWMQTNGYINIEASAADVKFGVVTLS